MENMTKKDTVVSQYADASNLNTRASLHANYSTNKYGFANWVYDQYAFTPGCRILELGCGSGDGWANRIGRLPPGAELVLSDFSQGMVNTVREKFGGNPQVRAQRIA